MNRIIILIFIWITTGGIYSQDLIPPTKLNNIKAIVIANISGDVHVKTTKTDHLTISGIIEANTEIKREIKVKTVTVNDTLVVYVDSPIAGFKIQDDENILSNTWAVYDWMNQNNCDETLDFTIDMEVSVPDEIPLSLSTINEGKITINQRQGPLWANNINGSITLKNVRDVRHAKTVNGDVDLYFTAGIKDEGTFYTLNGNINAYYPSGTDINFSFKSFNGDFYTDTDLETLPSVISSTSENKGFKLKVSESIRMKMGKGGPWHKFETFNGDAIVRSNNL